MTSEERIHNFAVDTYKSGYVDGCKDAWKAAKGIIEYEYKKHHDVYDATMILNRYTPLQAMDKLNEEEDGLTKIEGLIADINIVEVTDHFEKGDIVTWLRIWGDEAKKAIEELKNEK